MWRQSDFISPTAAKARIRWPSILALDGGGFLHLANWANWLLTGTQAFPSINPEGIQTEGGTELLETSSGESISFDQIIENLVLGRLCWLHIEQRPRHHHVTIQVPQIVFGCPHQVSGTQPVRNTQSLVYERCHPHHRQTYNMLQPKFFEYAVYHYMPWMLL